MSICIGHTAMVLGSYRAFESEKSEIEEKVFKACSSPIPARQSTGFWNSVVPAAAGFVERTQFQVFDFRSFYKVFHKQPVPITISNNEVPVVVNKRITS